MRSTAAAAELPAIARASAIALDAECAACVLDLRLWPARDAVQPNALAPLLPAVPMALRRAQVAAALGVEAGGARLHALVHAVVRAAADLLLRRADRAPLLEARASNWAA